MTLPETGAEAFRNLSANPLRSLLTMLGIIIGVAAVIAMAAIVEGGQQKLLQSVERLGTNLLFVFQKTLTPEEQRRFSGRSLGQRYRDVLAIRALRPDLRVVPMLQIPQQTKAADRTYSGTISGTVPDFPSVRNFRVMLGRFLLDQDIEERRRVVVMGKNVAERLFGSQSPLRNEVKIGEERFIVVGMMEPKGDVYGVNFDDMIFIPITTMFQRFTGDDKIDFMTIQVSDRRQMDATARQVHTLLTQRHDGVDDTKIHNQGEFLKAMDRTILISQIVLGGVAFVALLVGGIGIMNIMLVTVRERTSEVGLRKAVGASRNDILKQFLAESMMISLVGGTLGILVGVVGVYGFGDLVSLTMSGNGGWKVIIPLPAIVTAFLFSLSVGVAFGLYPAFKAAALDPADALRYR